jgi:hypothetical protein
MERYGIEDKFGAPTVNVVLAFKEKRGKPEIDPDWMF